MKKLKNPQMEERVQAALARLTAEIPPTNFSNSLWSGSLDDIPTEIKGTAQMLGILTGMRGYEYWQIGPVADRRLVALLQNKLEAAHAEIAALKKELGL